MKSEYTANLEMVAAPRHRQVTRTAAPNRSTWPAVLAVLAIFALIGAALIAANAQHTPGPRYVVKVEYPAGLGGPAYLQHKKPFFMVQASRPAARERHSRRTHGDPQFRPYFYRGGMTP